MAYSISLYKDLISNFDIPCKYGQQDKRLVQITTVPAMVASMEVIVSHRRTKSFGNRSYRKINKEKKGKS